MSNPRSKFAAPSVFVGGFMLLLGGFYKDTPGGIIGMTIGAGLVVLSGYLGLTACCTSSGSTLDTTPLRKAMMIPDAKGIGVANSV